MDRYRVTASFNGDPPQIRNFLPNAPSHISLPPKPHLEDPQIFPYLSPEAAKLGGGCRPQNADDSEISIFEAERYFNESQDSNLTSTNLTASLHAAAERCNLQRERSVSSLDGHSRNFRSRSFRATPTTSSEASWNSQAGLLRKSQGSLSVSVRSFTNGDQRKEPSSFGRRFFSYSCPCSGKKSIEVEEKDSELTSSIPFSCVKNNSSATKAPKLREEEVARTEEVEQLATVKVFPGIPPQDPEIFRSTGRFSLDRPFPAPESVCRVVDSGGFSFPVLTPRKKNASEDPARVSLEVFRPAEAPTPLRKSAEFQKSLVARDTGDRRSFTFPGSPKIRLAGDDDVASDTSSDLFEIESLSTQMGLRRKDSLDELPPSLFGPRSIVGSSAGVAPVQRGIDDEEAATQSIAPSECYPPSEVSVDWSVTTAEGFDRSSAANFSSAVSEYEEFRYGADNLSRWKKKSNGAGGVGVGLLSCRSERAVNVIGPKPVWLGPETQRRAGNSNSMFGLDRVIGVARLGIGKPVHDGSGPLGMRGRSSFLEPAITGPVKSRAGEPGYKFASHRQK